MDKIIKSSLNLILKKIKIGGENYLQMKSGQKLRKRGVTSDHRL